MTRYPFHDTIIRRVILDSDGAVAYHYVRNGKNHRLVLCKVGEDQKLFIKDPTSKKQVLVGELVRVGDILLLVFTP